MLLKVRYLDSPQVLEGATAVFKPALVAASYYDTLVSITYEGTAVDGFNYISVPTMTIPAESSAGVNYNLQVAYKVGGGRFYYLGQATK